MKLSQGFLRAVQGLVPLLLLLLVEQVSGFQGDGYMSSCPRHGTTAWNSDQAAEHLRYWIRTIAYIGGKEPQDKLIYFDDITDQVLLITNVDPVSNTTVGNAWKIYQHQNFNFHNGILYGPVDNSGLISGDDVVFLYPDLRTVLVGKFDKGVMIEAREGRISAERCQDGLKVIKVVKSKTNPGIYKYQKPTFIRPGDQPTLMDPYEHRTVYIGNGTFDDGLLAKRDIKAGELVAYYAGLLYNETQNPTRMNQTEEENYAIVRNRINLANELVLDLPMQYWNITKFRATLGHKVNHSFLKDQTRFDVAYHPRYGYIRSVVAKKDIRKGEEMFVQYGYGVNANSVPKWYKDLYAKEIGPLPAESN